MLALLLLNRRRRRLGLQGVELHGWSGRRRHRSSSGRRSSRWNLHHMSNGKIGVVVRYYIVLGCVALLFLAEESHLVRTVIRSILISMLRTAFSVECHFFLFFNYLKTIDSIQNSVLAISTSVSCYVSELAFMTHSCYCIKITDIENVS